MLEILNNSGLSKFFPNSGPGPIELLSGTAEIGYFGLVSHNLLFKNNELADALYLNLEGYTHYTNPDWLKFIYKGKILFVPRYPLQKSVSWSYLYKNGLVFGVDGVGPTNLIPSLEPTDQDSFVFKGNDRFRVRLFKADETNPTTHYIENSASVDDYTKTNEWNDLIYGLLADSPDTLPGGKLANFAISYLISSTSESTLTQTLVQAPGKQEYTVSVGNRTNITTKTIHHISDTLSNAACWRPVLELYREPNPIKDIRLFALPVYPQLQSAQSLGIEIQNREQLIPSTKLTHILEKDDYEPIYSDYGQQYITNDPLLKSTQLTSYTIAHLPKLSLNKLSVVEIEQIDFVLTDHGFIYKTIEFLTTSKVIGLEHLSRSNVLIPTLKLTYDLINE